MNYAISCILQNINGMVVTGVSQEKLINEITERKPNVLIFELEAGKANLALLEKIRNKYPDLKTLVLIESETSECGNKTTKKTLLICSAWVEFLFFWEMWF